MRAAAVGTGQQTPELLPVVIVTKHHRNVLFHNSGGLVPSKAVKENLSQAFLPASGVSGHPWLVKASL